MCCIERWLLLCVLLVEADALCGQLSTVQYLDLDHGASASAAADIDHEPARFTFPAADTTDYKEIDPLKTKALQVTRYEVENTRRRSSDKLMEAWFVHFISLCSVAVSISRMRQLHGCFVNLWETGLEPHSARPCHGRVTFLWETGLEPHSARPCHGRVLLISVLWGFSLQQADI